MREQLLFPLLLGFVGCTTQPPATRSVPERPWESVGMAAMMRDVWSPSATPLTEDLGLAADSVSSDSAITHFLSAKLVLPAHVQVGVLQLSAPVGRWGDVTGPDAMTQALADSVARAVSQAPRVAGVSVLPVLVVGQHPSVSRLREGAARMQADVLLVYRPGCRLYYRVPFFGSTDYRAVCTLEAAVLDIRSGLIPFSTVVTREQVARRVHGEFDDSETTRRAQMEAIAQGLSEVAARFGAFLEKTPLMSP
jgi:hypothetical protein